VGVASPEQAAPPLEQWLQPGDCLLLKASRGVALERLLPLLEQQFTAVDQGSPK
jgi:UDP-N-acetylmuramoyl-tripeptide--D-alanyl-D-alanine ligase